MSIPVIDTLSTLGNYPIVNSSDVQCNQKRLDEKISEIETSINQKGTYNKPSSGIPKSDFSSDVVASLNKADTALQTHQSLEAYAKKSEIPVNISSFTNDSGYLTDVPDGSVTSSKLSNEVKTMYQKDYVTPQMYGAKGDNSTDDTEAIQACIDDNPGKTIYFPIGNYVISKPLVLNSIYTKLKGEFGKSRIVKKNDTTLSEYSFTIGTNTYDLSDVNACLIIAPENGSVNGTLWANEILGMTFLRRDNSTENAYAVYVVNAPLLRIVDMYTSVKKMHIEIGYTTIIESCQLNETRLELVNTTSMIVSSSSLATLDSRPVVQSSGSLSSFVNCAFGQGELHIENNSTMQLTGCRTEAAEHILYAINSHFIANNCNFEKHQDISFTDETKWFVLRNSKVSITDSILRFQNYTEQETWTRRYLWSVDDESFLTMQCYEKNMPQTTLEPRQKNVIYNKYGKNRGEATWAMSTSTNYQNISYDGITTKVSFSIEMTDFSYKKGHNHIGKISGVPNPPNTVYGIAKFAKGLADYTEFELVPLSVTWNGNVYIDCKLDSASGFNSISGFIMY